MTKSLEKNVGKKCRKKPINKTRKNGMPHKKSSSPKPFKSGFKINTIKGVIPHKQLEGQMAYTFEEDDSYVECRRCEVIEKKSLFKRIFRL